MVGGIVIAMFSPQKKPKTPLKGIRLLKNRLGYQQVDTYTSIKSLATTLRLCNPLLLDEQINTLDLTE